MSSDNLNLQSAVSLRGRLGKTYVGAKILHHGGKVVALSLKLIQQARQSGVSSSLGSAPYLDACFSIISLVPAILNAIQNVKLIKELKGRERIVPLFIISVDLGDVINLFKTAIDLVAQKAAGGLSASATTALSVLSTTFGVALIGLQIVGAGVQGVAIYSLHHQSLLVSKKGFRDEEAVSEPKGLSKIFRPFNKKQLDKINKVFKSLASEMSTFDMRKLKGQLKGRFRWLKGSQSLGITIAVICIIGLALLCFAPTPAAPVAWALLGTAFAVEIGRLITSVVLSRRFNRYLHEQKERLETGDVELTEFGGNSEETDQDSITDVLEPPDENQPLLGKES